MGLPYELSNKCEPSLECDLRVSHENMGPKLDCHVISECYVKVSSENVVRTRPQNFIDCLDRQKQIAFLIICVYSNCFLAIKN